MIKEMETDRQMASRPSHTANHMEREAGTDMTETSDSFA